MKRFLRRSVQPFDDVFVDVDLFAVMALFGGGSKLDDILPLYRWIRNESIRLDVIDLRHAMPPDHEPVVRELAEWASGRTYAHQYLCGLSAAYIQLVLGKISLSCHSDRESHDMKSFFLRAPGGVEVQISGVCVTMLETVRLDDGF